MNEQEIQAIRGEIEKPAKPDYDARCENGSCHKASRLAERTEELLDEVVRLRAWLTAISREDDPNGYSWTGAKWARQALAGDDAPA